MTDKEFKQDDLMENLAHLKDKKRKGELDIHTGTIDIIVPKKRNVQISNKVTEETYKNLV
jgi:hypothetical protein